MLKIGDSAPEINLKNNDGEEIKLSDFKGKKVVIYFYPKDNTPGCNKEACSIRDVYDDILDTGAVILGISPDSVESHKRFKDKFQLPFHLLSDPEKEVSKAFGAWGEKKSFGKTYMGIIRSTFILDENHKIEKVYPKVKPENHGEEILNDLKK